MFGEGKDAPFGISFNKDNYRVLSLKPQEMG